MSVRFPRWILGVGEVEDVCSSIMYSIVQVLCIVKPLAAARYSQIGYQAVVVWTGSDKNMPQVNLLLHTIITETFIFRNLVKCLAHVNDVKTWE